MKTLNEWFADYAISHQNPINQKIHFICVPVIYFSIVGLLLSIPNTYLQNTLNTSNPIIANWGVVILLPILIFYIRLSTRLAVKMLIFSTLCLLVNIFISTYIPILYVSLFLFATAWVGQFYGHKVEGKKPSFLKDLQFLLIGPAWVLKKLKL